MSNVQDMLNSATRIVIKIGSSTLTEGGQVRHAWLQSLAADVVALQHQGKEVAIVTSGSIALGKQKAAIESQTATLPEKQAAAAIGQTYLIYGYQEAFAAHGSEVAQILLSVQDTEHRKRYLNAQDTLRTLLAKGVVPVINENDTVATQEIRFGDNDRLSARVAQMLGADVLILLSDIDGLYTAPPGTEGATHIPVIEEITDDIRAMAQDSSSLVGTGGMITKLLAADIALQAGCHTLIASGQAQHAINALCTGTARSSWCKATQTALQARKGWIAGSLHVAGSVRIDAGAARALQDGASLLLAGVTACDGSFERGDAVEILGQDGVLLGKGLIAYNHAELAQLFGAQSGDVAATLGYPGPTAAIHRDDLALVS